MHFGLVKNTYKINFPLGIHQQYGNNGIPKSKINLGNKASEDLFLMEIFHNFILGRPGLAIVDSFIGCRFRNMTISHGISKNKPTLYPPAK
jgi:hypothetical protein